MKFFGKLLGTLIIMLLILGCIGGYFGLVPGFSKLFGADKPKDLGVQASAAEFAAGNSKVALQRLQSDPAAGSKGLAYQGSHSVDAFFTSEELTSLMQQGLYKYNPIAEDFQMKVHDDGSVETSGLLDIGKLKMYMKDANLGSVDEYAKTYGLLAGKIPFYANGTASITNNKASLKFTDVKIGRVSVPAEAAQTGASALLNQRLKSIPGMSITSLTFDHGKMHLVGTYPDKLEVVK